ncbi:pseudouridine synthase [Algihabitans albus]|uniref:pseudouridine synthase n=1 Tax=Algihabitans albus TaxID=2164067 RepID=UPI000E5CB9D5|nr:pseudouridine synthase [Algihabitans albus]
MPQDTTGPSETDGTAGERIAKAIARSGLCSRREAEALIAQGRVELDGAPVASPAVNVTPSQAITVDGEPLPRREPPRLWRYHKPTGLLTTERDPEGRPTVFDRLPAGLPRVMPVGRLDLSSEGLLLLTNDGGLKRQLELPATGWRRRYRVRVFGMVAPKALERLRDGIEVDGVSYGPIEAQLDNKPTERTGGANAWLTMTLREGKNREIRRVCEALGLRVNRLIRLAFGPFQLGALKPGEVEEVPPKVMKEQLGTKLAVELGVTSDAHRRR